MVTTAAARHAIATAIVGSIADWSARTYSGGATVTLEGLHAPAIGWAVGVKGCERALEYASPLAIVQAVKVWLESPTVADTLETTPGAHVGAWVDNGRIILDVSIVTDRERALDVAAQTGERAIFDLESGETITLDHTACSDCGDSVTYCSRRRSARRAGRPFPRA